jgi:peptidyl-tRNA hydrolase ICT1
MLQIVKRVTATSPLRPISGSVITRYKRYEAFDAHLDQGELAEARAWYQSFEASQLPKGNTTYARSSGPGGQHVNKYVAPKFGRRKNELI